MRCYRLLSAGAVLVAALTCAFGISEALAAPGDRVISSGIPDAQQTRVAYAQQHVEDLARAVAFYAKGLGMRVTRDFQTADGSFKEISVAFDDNLKSTAIILTWRRGQAKPVKPDWPMKLILQVPDVKAALAQALSAGGTLKRDVTAVGEGALTAEFLDPEGQPVELLQLVSAPAAGAAKAGGPPLQVPRIGYSIQYVANLQRSVDFYTKVLGMKVTRRMIAQGGGFKEVNVAFDGNPDSTAIILTWTKSMKGPLPARRWPLHMILQVQDIEGTIKRVAASSGKIVSRQIFGPATKLHYMDALRDNLNAVNGFIEDPDGYQVELLKIL